MYDYMNQPVLASQLCFERDADSFFNPETLRHTGFDASGTHYTAGVPNTGTIASWCSEGESATRGAGQAFPEQALVLLSRASLTILDATTEDLDLWMLFYYADQCALSDNGQGAVAGYLPTGVSWNNGLLSIILQPDAGSTPQAPVVLTIDFTQDTVYADSHA